MYVLQLPALDSKLLLEVGGGIANGDLILTGDFGAIYVSRLSLNGVTASHGAFEQKTRVFCSCGSKPAMGLGSSL